MPRSTRNLVAALLFSPVMAIAGINITSFPYVNHFSSQADVDEATHSGHETCVGTITWESSSGWSGGAYKLRLNDLPNGTCSPPSKSEDTAGIGAYSWTGFPNETQINVGALFYFGSNFYQPLDDDDLIKWMLLSAGGTGYTRPMMALKHYGAGLDFKVWQACWDSNSTGCKDEFGQLYQNGGCCAPSEYSFQWDDRLEEWIWIEFEVVTGGNTTVYIYTSDGELSGITAQTNTNTTSPYITNFNEMSYWEGASGTTADTYVMVDELTIDTAYIGPPAGFLGGDTTPPSVFLPLPSGELAAGTTGTTISVTATDSTSGISGCKYDTTDTTYAAMANTLSAAGGGVYSASVSGLSNGGSYTYYARCIDGSANANTSSTVISFTVASGSDTTPPVISGLLPSGQQNTYQSPVTLQVTTDESATCRFGLASYTWDQMTPMGVTGGTTHTHDIVVPKNANLYYGIRCRDASSNESSDTIIFQTRGAGSGTSGGFLGMLEVR